jgi:hypothetical protein
MSEGCSLEADSLTNANIRYNKLIWHMSLLEKQLKR